MIILAEKLVQEKDAGKMALDFVLDHFDNLPSRSSAKKAIKRGEILVDGVQATPLQRLQPGQQVTLADLEINPPRIYPLKLDVHFQDEYLAVVYKPAGIPVSGNRYKTVLNALPFNIKPSNATDALKWPRPVHRLDIPTQGLLLVAKSAAALTKLGRLLQQRQIQKRYRAVVAGRTGSGIIDHPVGGKEALTRYQTVRQVNSLKTAYLSLVDLYPVTGRKHQLRVHMAATGHPVVGDKTYTANAPLLKGKGLFLCAVELAFQHPVTSQQILVKVDAPAKFNALMEREAARWKKYHGQ